MKISNTILAVFQLMNHMSAKAAHKFMAKLDNIFYVCAQSLVYHRFRVADREDYFRLTFEHF
jgi:hypothetical protein